MEEENHWMNLFFSGSCPDFLRTTGLGEQTFQPFCAEDNWDLGRKVDISRVPDEKSVQVFWLRIKGHRKFIAKVFPCYSEQDAKIQLCRIRVLLTPETINDAVHEFDRFYREARAYSHIDLFCSARERIYFPKFHGVITDIPKIRFSSGYFHKRAVVLEAIKPDLRSRRVLSESVSHQSESFLAILETLSERLCTSPEVISLSSFEQEWYHSLLKDRLRRLDALHRIVITHGDIHDFHFRLPNDFYDTVLYDFSESYTFSIKKPFRVSGGRLRPLSSISNGERERVLLHVLDRVALRDLRSHLKNFNFKASVAGIDHIASVENALWQSLETENASLELIILKVFYRPDDFAMPTLNSIFPFLEAICPHSDLCWHIRRGRLLCQYDSAWAVFRDDKAHPQSITFDCEPQFGMIEKEKNSCFILCLVPHSWGITPFKKAFDFAGLDTLRKLCASFESAELPGIITSRAEFWKEAEHKG